MDAKADKVMTSCDFRHYLVVRSLLQGWRVPGLKPDFTEDLPCMGLLHAKSYLVAKQPPTGVVWKLGGGRKSQLRCSPCHLTAVQDSEVHPKIALKYKP
ncbi:hypothetical protein AVEN_164641-1 [Araneus ventricosus]|uniref:Uncharacterized protein n=1 Tax=Araneus ventricosus TaxID=182803 RepID=A0A4Y2WH80_ARAVE|nr:hypothetical protein AVEN_164641-1 [Araneus ventricosus]